MKRSLVWVALFALFGASVPDLASAIIIQPAYPTIRLGGRTVRTSFLYPDLSTVYAPNVDTFITNSTLEIPEFAGISSIEFGDTAIILTLLTSGSGTTAPFYGWRFTDIDGGIDDFQSVEVFQSTTTDPFVVSFDADNIWVNAGAGQHFEAGQRLVLVIPEPSTGWLIASGFGLLAALARRR